MGSFTYLRRDITRRVKVALGLIMTRGVYVECIWQGYIPFQQRGHRMEVVKARCVEPQIDIRLHTYHWPQAGPIYSTLPSKCKYNMPYH